jgi:MoaA/NifB/PqqE/SkfB family radical SAM enzyme
MRGLDGLLDNAIEGIRVLKNSKKNVYINSVLCNLNISKIEGLIGLSEELQIPIVFQPIDVIKGVNDHLTPKQSEIQKAFLKIIKYKKLGYKILNTNFYLNHIVENKKYVCHFPKWFIFLLPNGNVVSCCDKIDKLWGNIRSTTFKEIYKSKEFRDFNIKYEGCNVCSSNLVIETSLLYSFNPKFLKNFNDIIRLYNPYWGFNKSNSKF